MRILHINSYFVTSGLFDQLYQRQAQAGLDLDVYVPIATNYPEERIAARGSYTRVRRVFPEWTRWIFWLKHYRILSDLMNQYTPTDYDLIHAHSLFSNGWIAYQLHRRYGLPYVVAVRNADLRTFMERMPWMRGVGHKILQSAERIVFISSNTYEEVYDRYIPASQRVALQSKSEIIPNGIDDFWHIHRLEQLTEDVHQPIRIVCTSKILRTKRLVELADKVANYSRQIRSAELHLIGPAWEEDVLEQLKAYPEVIYHGPQTKEELVATYRKMDLFAMLSYPETFGLVYVEAMSQGLPVLYTQGEGFDNYFPNYEIGVSVHPHDQVAFNHAVDYVVDHLSELRSTVVEKIAPFQWDRITQIYLDMYASIKGGNQL